MINKNRFTIKHERTIADNENKENYVISYQTDAKTLCDTLNHLNDMNEQLQIRCDAQYETLQLLKREIKKKTEYLNKSNVENEELLNELRVYRKIANCYNCNHHDYDEFANDDGSYDEYEVCRKGNDVILGICEDYKRL